MRPSLYPEGHYYPEIIRNLGQEPQLRWYFPMISFYARTRGWYFVIAWCHRITGILLVILVWFHICFSSFPHSGGAQAVKWILAIPVIFHAFNGGRLMLYEIFGRRNEESMLRWMSGLSIIYLAVLGLLMLMPNQSVSPFFFWLLMVAGALIVTYGVGKKIWMLEHSVFWKFQRITAGFLVVTVPGYLLFTCLSPYAGMETGVGITGMQRHFTQVVYLGILVGALYHGGYGIWSLALDYLSSRRLRISLGFLVTLVMMVFGWLGVRVILVI